MSLTSNAYDYSDLAPDETKSGPTFESFNAALVLFVVENGPRERRHTSLSDSGRHLLNRGLFLLWPLRANEDHARL